MGVVLYCSGRKFLKMQYVADSARIAALWPETDTAEVCTYLDAFGMICAGAKEGGPIAGLGIAERFRWLTATRSTIVQCSKVHPGFCDDPDAMLAHLFGQLVM